MPSETARCTLSLPHKKARQCVVTVKQGHHPNILLIKCDGPWMAEICHKGNQLTQFREGRFRPLRRQSGSWERLLGYFSIPGGYEEPRWEVVDETTALECETIRAAIEKFLISRTQQRT
jgi:hypothetical protein